MTSKTPDTAIDVATPNQWPMIPLGKLGRWGSGGTPKRGTPGYYDGDIPWLKISDLNDGEVFESEERITALALQNSSAKLLEPGALLIAMYGSIGKLGVNKIPCATNQAIAFCYPNQQVSLKYLFWAMKTLRPQLTAEGKGGTQQNISQGVLKDFEVPVPPRDLQDEIVSFIEVALATLEVPANRIARIPSLLKKFRQSVLAAACSGHLTADWRNKPHDKTLVAGERPQISVSRFTRSLADSEPIESLPTLYELPQSWTWAPISALSKIVRGASPRPAGDPKLFGGPVPWITVGPLTADSTPYLRATPTGLTELGKVASRVVQAETFLLTNSGATLGVPKITMIEGCINDGVVAFIDPCFDKLYAFYYLSSMTMTLREINQGMGQPNLNTDIVRRIPFPLPPLEEQAEIVRRVESLFALADSIESRLAEATTQVERTTQAILAKAFRGDL